MRIIKKIIPLAGILVLLAGAVAQVSAQSEVV